VTLNVQTDLGRDIRNETLFALSNLRTSSVSLTVKLSRSANLRFEYYGTRVNYELNRDSILASALLGNSVEPVLGGANRNVFFVQYQKTLRWGKSASAEYDKTTTGVAIVRPVGTVGGRVFVDENENGVWDEGEPGAGNAIVSLNQLRKTTTDESGRFEFTGVAVGPNEIALESDTLSAIFTPTVLRQPVAVAFKARVQTDFPLRAGSSISGRVTEKKGDEIIPVADAAIRLEPSGLYGYSDSSGEFSISNVPRGTYKLTVVPETVDHQFRVVSGPRRRCRCRPGRPAAKRSRIPSRTRGSRPGHRTPAGLENQGWPCRHRRPEVILERRSMTAGPRLSNDSSRAFIVLTTEEPVSLAEKHASFLDLIISTKEIIGFMTEINASVPEKILPRPAISISAP